MRQPNFFQELQIILGLLLTSILKLRKLIEITFQWKANFNPDYRKQGQELVFSCRYQTKSCRAELPINSKLFVDNNLFFKVVKNHNQYGIDLSTNLKNISKWRFLSNKL